MNDTNWLDELKVGDSVAVNGRYGVTIVKVEGVTKTQIVADESRFNKSNGKRRGDDAWSLASLEPVTPKLREQIRLKKLRDKVFNFFLRQQPQKVSVSQLERIAAILEETNE